MVQTIEDRQYKSFVEIDGIWYRRTQVSGSVEGSFAPSGLKNGGAVTEVTLNDSTWTALPGTSLTDRNAIAIQNLSGNEIKINYDNGVSGYVGMTIPDGGERQYDLTDAITIYGKAESGATPTITVEELS